MSYQYFGVFCSGKFLALWDAPAPIGPTAGVPVTELDKPALVRNCPGCQRDHIFQPNELKLCAPVNHQLPLHSFEEQDGEHQVEAGKKIIKELLGTLATELEQPQINDLSFIVTDQDFDRSQLSIFDPNHKSIVTKVNRNDLADAPASAVVRRKLETQLRQAVTAYLDLLR